ncbi:MAG: glycosyltransferase family 4 protein [Flavobacteriales bacterium]|nr:glycosyltransferase family 4 protein [Flavobacteriales bacterium]
MNEIRKPKLVYCTTIMASFARKDVELLSKEFEVVIHVFAPRTKLLTPWSLIRQFFFLLLHLPSAAVSVTQFGGFHSFLPALFGRVFKVPAIISLGGYDCASFPSFRYGAHHRFPMGWMTRASLRMANHLVPCSANLIHSEQHYSAAQGDPVHQGYKAFDPANNTQYTVVAYGYDPERFKPSGARRSGSFLTVAQMNTPNFQRKGIDLFFAMADRFPQCHFTLVGNTPAMRYERVPENAELIGFIPYEELPALYARHEFYLQLSIWEGFPSAPCEAMLCGCVPIVSKVAALPEIVGDTGFIVEHRNVDELQRTIEAALGSESLRKGEAARKRIKDRYPLSTRSRFSDLVFKAARSSEGSAQS